MINNLIIAATIFFSAGAADYSYRLLRTAYWYIKDMVRERKWRKEADARSEEMNAALAAVRADGPLANTTPVAF